MIAFRLLMFITQMAERGFTAGVTTIAGGKVSRGGGHVDGPSEDAKFSNDFDVVYVGSSCSLLVIDRGNRAIREIQLHFDDCAYQYGSGFPFGMPVYPNFLSYMYICVTGNDIYFGCRNCSTCCSWTFWLHAGIVAA